MTFGTEGKIKETGNVLITFLQYFAVVMFGMRQWGHVRVVCVERVPGAELAEGSRELPTLFSFA
jgi:hypothetical protein